METESGRNGEESAPEAGRHGTGALWFRLLAEFAVVFAGVIGALLADDWRETRNDRDAAHEALSQIEVDLELDSAEYDLLREAVTEQMRGAAWLVLNLDRAGVPPDSVTDAMSRATIGRLFQPTGAAYRSLRDGGNLHLLEDGELRAQVVRYYEDSQAYLRGLYALVESSARDVESRLLPHRRRLPDPESLDFGRGGRWQLVRPPADIAGDGELLNLLGLFGGRASYLAARLDQTIIPANAEMLARVRDALSEG